MAGSTPASPTASASPRAAGPSLSVTPGAEAWRRFRRHRLALAGAVILSILVFGVLFGPLLWPVSINEIDFTARLKPPS